MSANVASKNTDFLPLKRWPDRWWKPAEFLAAVDAHRQRFQYFEDMYQPRLKHLNEAWAASSFAVILSQDRPVSIRLERDCFPDFILRVRNESLPFELVVADHEERQRDKEYRLAAARKAEGLPPEMESFDPDTEESAAIAAIRSAIEIKARKRYSPAPHLLVYANFIGKTDEPPITNLLAPQLAYRWSKSFKSCWVLWEHYIFRLWPSAAKIRDQTGSLLVARSMFTPALHIEARPRAWYDGLSLKESLTGQ